MAIMRLVFTGTILGQLVQNVVHFDNIDGALTHDDIKTEMLAGWIPILRNIQNANLSWTALSVQRIQSPPDIATLYPLSGQVGSLSGAPAPTVLCGLFSIRSATPGRHGHGRFYLFGVHGESVLNSIVQSGALAAYQNAANNLIGRYGVSGSTGLRLGVCPRNDPTNFHPATAIVVRPTFGIQRRRNIGVGG
jgi:hypothetical protein